MDAGNHQVVRRGLGFVVDRVSRSIVIIHDSYVDLVVRPDLM